MPMTNPAFPRGPYRFFNREYLIITSRTDPDALRAVVPEPLEAAEPIVKYEFIRMPDFTGFGDYTERTSGQGNFAGRFEKNVLAPWTRRTARPDHIVRSRTSPDGSDAACVCPMASTAPVTLKPSPRSWSQDC